jgi:hypothetical protein
MPLLFSPFHNRLAMISYRPNDRLSHRIVPVPGHSNGRSI